VKELFVLLDGLRAGKITEDELAKARVRYRYETMAAIDDASAMVGWFGGTALYYEPPSLSHRLEQMAAVKLADLKRVAEQVLDPAHLAIAAVGSLSRARLGELRSVISSWS
jgi:predicted Zn-dependent peptidase